MIKRMTLLARKDGTSVSDFRAYWAGCHAELALCMNGISSYTQNRVDKVLWQLSDDDGCFQVDGVVELCFENENVMHEAQSSAVGSKYIPEDEPNFLRGWSLCVVENDEEQTEPKGVKVIVLAVMKTAASKSDLRMAVKDANDAQRSPARLAFNWTSRTASRERLWSEPSPPDALVSLWFENVADAHAAFESGGRYERALLSVSDRAAAYLINTLVVK
ncbi:MULTISPECIES: EthD domain-containing protein [unclassified Paraburkholderia]|uniref:EthD domain-containing protein n=1 Tax=unclassified Paraburkholderia TaxID=2615204 RepID=UPI0038B8D72B